MPSGAKKRKAAKKKKELEANFNSSTNSSQGNEDAKSQDDRGSDNGEVDSPASQNHPSHNNPFNEGNKEIQESSTSMAGALGHVESTEKAGLENSGVLESQRDWKFEDASERKNGCLQNEPVKGSHDDDHSSSSSSSDDESLDRMKKPEVPAGETDNLAVATASIVYSVTPEVSASEETINVAESASVDNTVIPDVIASEKLETPLPTTDGVTFVPMAAVMDLSSKQNEDRVLYLSGESVKGSSGALESTPEKYGQKISQPLDDGVSETSNCAAHVKDSKSQEHSTSESEVQPLIASRPQVAERTSWLSCCGLCDVLSGSNR